MLQQHAGNMLYECQWKLDDEGRGIHANNHASLGGCQSVINQLVVDYR